MSRREVFEQALVEIQCAIECGDYEGFPDWRIRDIVNPLNALLKDDTE